MGGIFRFLLWAGLLIGAVVGLARLVAVRWIRLPEDDPVLTASVQPSLGAGDLILLQRFAPAEFGDLVLCPEPGYPERYVIGRVIGLPKDRVEVKDGRIGVNGKAFPFERPCHPPTVTYPNPNDASEEVEQACFYEALASQRVHKTGSLSRHRTRPEDRHFDVPDEHFFLISDNRLFPYDSRDYDVVPIDSCKETVILRLVGKDGWSDPERRMNFIQ
jgi:signal peptidase I